MKQLKLNVVRRCMTIIFSIVIAISAFPNLPDIVQDGRIAIVEAASWSEIHNPKPNKSTHADFQQYGHITEYSYVYFGSYPQSEVTGKDLTSSIINAKYDGNGEAIINGVKYKRLSKDTVRRVVNYEGYYNWNSGGFRYFRYQPIKWRVLELTSGTIFLLAESALDTQQFYPTSANRTWAASTVRSWLNGYGASMNSAGEDYSKVGQNFMHTAFDTAQISCIQTTHLENPPHPEFQVNSGASTQDKIFLLSYDELSKEDFGFCVQDKFYGCKSLSIVMTDYTYAMGLQKYPGSSLMLKNKATWLSRTKGQDILSVTEVLWGGTINGIRALIAYEGIVPALKLNRNNSKLHKVMFYSAGGNSIDSQYHIGNSQIIKPDNPSRQDYTFGGWYTDSACTKLYNFANIISSDMTLYAKWTKKEPPVDTKITDQEKSNYVITKSGDQGRTVMYTGSNDKNATKITIPSTVTINGYTYQVTSIANDAFKNNQKLKSITIGSNVKTIGARAFKNCKALKKIVIPAKVQNIGKEAFYNCKKLKNINIKTSKLTNKSVGKNAFKKTHSKAVVKTPKKKLNAYKKMLPKKGLSKKANVKK